MDTSGGLPGVLVGLAQTHMTVTAVQCETINVVALLLMLVAHGTFILLKHSRLTTRRVCVAVIVAAGVYVIAVRGIVILTIMHQIMGMMATEGAVRALHGPLIVTTSCTEALLLLAVFFANFMIVIGEFAIAIRWYGGGVYPVVFGDAGLTHFGSVPFYQKQHAVLHFFLCVLAVSVATSLRPRWRRSLTVQQARIIIEPACITGVALILFTHHHGTGSPDLASHPAIGTLICLCAASQVASYMAHVAVPTDNGATPDVTAVLPRGVSPVVRMVKAFNAYAYLLLAYFLYIDSYMEYLGCRFQLLKPHATEGLEHLGLDSETELSTYLGLAIVGAALALALLLAHGGPEAHGPVLVRDTEHLVNHPLLATDKDAVTDEPHVEGGRTAPF